jgi:ATP-binding cassette subfamily B protein
MDRMDEIVVLDRGHVVERGVHSDLLAGQGLYARMWAAQRSLLAE